jgi:hypothetical protein
MRFLNNLKLLTKIAIPVVVFIAIAVGLIVMAVSSLDQVNEDIHTIVESDAKRLSLVQGC